MTLLDISEEKRNFSGQRVLIPLSGGINSAAVLCWIGETWPAEKKPLELHLFYSHFREHSPGTARFVTDQMRYARGAFSRVVCKIARHSVNRFFERQHMIPHPSISPCSTELKIKPKLIYIEDHKIDVELIGFVKEDFRRFKRAQGYENSRGADYPLLHWNNEECFAFVKKVIGWYPAIYDIREKGKRVFSHNNCLPCKNMSSRQLAQVGKYFPEYARRARATADKIPGGYWGRDDVPDVFVCDNCARLG